jgi:hypothetical protein
MVHALIHLSTLVERQCVGWNCSGSQWNPHVLCMEDYGHDRRFSWVTRLLVVLLTLHYIRRQVLAKTFQNTLTIVLTTVLQAGMQQTGGTVGLAKRCHLPIEQSVGLELTPT